MSFKTLQFPTHFLLTLLFFTAISSKAQVIYSHNFGTTLISSHPYTVTPTTLNPYLSNSSWTNSENLWTSTTGATGQAIRLTSATNSTITLTFNVDANYKLDITSFNFWRVRSNTGATNWSMTINGITAGSGTIPTTGAAIGNTNVGNPVSGLRGTVTVVISLTGNTGNGTFRLDDFTLNGNVVLDCTPSIVTSISPVTGPQNTLVTINGSGFLAGTGTSSVQFNGIISAFNVISDTKIEAYVPSGNATGNITITTNGCPAVTVPFTKIVSDVPTNYSTDIYISEIHDVGTTGDGGIGGSGGIIEIYNGTASTVNLAGYSVKRYGDVGDTNPSIAPLNLVGSIPPGGIFLLGLGNTRCSVSYDQTFNTGFNENDEFELLKNGVIIDNVHLLFAQSGYTLIRKPDAVAPKAVFNGNDWHGYDLEICTNIGIHNVTVPALPTITSPVSNTVCENGPASFSVALSNPAGYSFQWKVLNSFGVWTNITNNAQYSGATTNTLIINGVPNTFNNNQYFCQMTALGKVLVSNAAQLKVSTGIVPDFDITPLSLCFGSTAPALNTISPNGISGTWSPATISNTAPGSYVFTPNAGQCAVNVTLVVTINQKTIPDFATRINICNGQTAPALSTTSPNGISGTWLPSIIDTTTDGTYIFTPNAGQCAENATLNVIIDNPVTPDFNYQTAYCHGDTVPVLATTSPNGISGTWSPAAINNTVPGTYTFTPNAGQCATNYALNVIINSKTAPDFNYPTTYCFGSSVPLLATVSPNGISGTWNPATISNTAGGTYTFTPNAGQCATNYVLNVTVTTQITPAFDQIPTICNGAPAPFLNTTSLNGITGTWNPATISNTAPASYIFTPDAGQCAGNFTMNVSVVNRSVPDFNYTTSYCLGDTVPVLASVSPNGISGTWSPTAINNTAPGTYTFTPNASECATIQVMNVTIVPKITPDFNYQTAYCHDDTVPVLASVSPNGISGTWSPAAINNTVPGTYTFTPNAGQCATNYALNVIINSKTVPDFNYPTTYCFGSSVPVLATVSPNGISGTWSPATISNTAGGTYTFTPNAGQCATNYVLNIVINSKTVPDFNYSTTYCFGSSVPVLATVSPNGITGTWNPSTISNTAGGTYTFTPNAGQCAMNASLVVTLNNGTLSPISGSSAVCENDSIQLANSTANGIWTSSNTLVATVDANGLVTGISSGSAIITYSLSSGSCNSSVSKTIAVNPLPKPILEDKSICIDQSGIIISNGQLNTRLPDNGTYNFYWTLDNTALTTTGSIHFANRAGTYKVVVTNLSTGCSSSATAVVTILSMATATATVAEDFGRNQTITINVTGGSGNFEYQLNDGQPQESNEFNGVFSGEYEIIVRDKNGCEEIFLEVFALNYPRYFTPNGDGYHETWNIDDLENQAEAKIYIFDRYGKLIKLIKPSSSGWNGTYNGQPLPSTDYWFQLLYTGRDGKQKEFKSHFSLKR